MLGIRGTEEGTYFALLSDNKAIYATKLSEEFIATKIGSDSWTRTENNIKENSYPFVLPYQFVRGGNK